MKELLVEVRDEVAVVTLNRPFRKNALSIELMDELTEYLLTCDEQGIVLTGSGDVFSSGIDTSLLPGDMGGAEEALGRLSSTILNLSKVVIAALNGPCLGGAVEVAMACDVRVGSPGTFFEIPAARLGILYRPEGLQILSSRISQQVLARLLLLNERVGAAAAEAGGLVACVSVDAVSAAAAMFGGPSLISSVVAATKQKLLQLEQGVSDFSVWDKERAEFFELIAPQS